MKSTTCGELVPAVGFDVSQISSDPTVVMQLKQLHSLAIGICPNCLVQRRGDDAIIYVPVERQDARSNKNLLTLWAQASGVRMRIMPEPEEMYAPNNFATYRERLSQLLRNLRERAN